MIVGNIVTGTIVQRHKNSFSLVLSLGRQTDPVTGKSKRVQKWITFRPAKGTPKRQAAKQANAKLAELLDQHNKGTFLEPSRLTLLEYLRSWHAKSVAPLKRPETARVYASIIETHVAHSPLAALPLQRVRAADLEQYYAGLTGKASSATVHHAILARALKMATRDGLIAANPASAVEHRPRVRKSAATDAARVNCWSATEARLVLDAAKSASPQLCAFVFLALDTGARKSELHGLQWDDVDVDAATVTISKQLDTAGTAPVFGPTKTKTTRLVTIGPETIARLRAHKRSQAELKMANRTAYQDYNLVFAREHEDLQTPDAVLGQPIKTLSERRFQYLVKGAGVRRVKFHALRHTCATLALEAGVPIHVVAQRLGHAQIATTLETYTHVLKGAQQDAATRLSAVLHG